MSETATWPAVTFDTAKMQQDMAERGWVQRDLARAAQVSDATVSDFLRGHSRSARTAAKLSIGLGFSVRRYVRRRRHD